MVQRTFQTYIEDECKIGRSTLTLHKQHGLILLKTFILQGLRTFSQAFKDITICEFEQGPQNRRVVYPSGKSRHGGTAPSTFATLGSR